MKKKTKIVFSSAMSIAMCASLIAGGTMALFTSTDVVNVAVTSGKVSVVATAGGLETYSMDKGTLDLKGGWTNGGAATVNANEVTLNKITPGDSASFTVQIDNQSSISVIYRTVVDVVADDGLMSGLSITIDENVADEEEALGFVGFACSPWTLLEAGSEGEVTTAKVTISLPKEAGNEYFDKTARLVFRVEAVQSNAGYDGAREYNDPFQNNEIWNATDLKYFASLVNSGAKDFKGEEVCLMSDIDLNGAPMMPIGTKENPFLGTFKSGDADEKTIVATASDTTEADFAGYTVSDFTVRNVTCGGLFGYAGKSGVYATIENIGVADAEIYANRRAGGVVGYIWGSVNGCQVSDTAIEVTPQLVNNRTYMNGDKAGGVVGWGDNGTFNYNVVKNVTVSAYRDIGGVIGCIVHEGIATEAKYNTLESVLVSYDTTGVTTYDENGKAESRNNANIVAGRINPVNDTPDVSDNALADVMIPGESHVATGAGLAYALENGGNVEITENVTMENETQIVISEDTELELNLNGKTIVGGKYYASTNEDGYVIRNQGTLVINGDENSIVSANGLVNGFGAILNEGTLILNGGTYTGSVWDGTAGDTPGYTIRNQGNMVINEGTTVHGTFGSVSNPGGNLTINGGTFTNDDLPGETNYLVSVWSGGHVEINGGDFTFTSSDANAMGSPIVGAWGGGTITINGGTFDAKQGAMGYKDAPITITGGIFKNAAANVFSGKKIDLFIVDGYTIFEYADNEYVIVEEGNGAIEYEGEFITLSEEMAEKVVDGSAVLTGSATLAKDEEAIQTALSDGKEVLLVTDSVADVERLLSYLETGEDAEKLTIATRNSDAIVTAAEKGIDVVLTDNVTAVAGQSSGYGATGVVVVKGGTIDGNGNAIAVPEATGTWDSAICAVEGTLKNVKVTAGFRGVFIKDNASTVYLDNVYIDGTTYTISCDQGKGGGLVMTNSTLKGWTSYAATIGEVSFTNCNFGAGNGYAFCRPYATTTFTNCNFEAGYEMDPRANVTFVNCYYNGVLITEENLATLVTSNIQNATVANN